MISKIIIIAAVVLLCIIAADVVKNIKDMAKTGTKGFSGEPMRVTAVVTGGTVTKLTMNRSASTAQNITTVDLKYEVDGIDYVKTIDLVDVHKNIKVGDTVELLCDSMAPLAAVMADGSDKQSAKNALGWDAAYAFIVLFFATFMFLKINS